MNDNRTPHEHELHRNAGRRTRRYKQGDQWIIQGSHALLVLEPGIPGHCNKTAPKLSTQLAPRSESQLLLGGIWESWLEWRTGEPPGTRSS